MSAARLHQRAKAKKAAAKARKTPGKNIAATADVAAAAGTSAYKRTAKKIARKAAAAKPRKKTAKKRASAPPQAAAKIIVGAAARAAAKTMAKAVAKAVDGKTAAKKKAAKPRKKIRSYRHLRQTRFNIPDAGIAHKENPNGQNAAPRPPKVQYQFDRHLHPQLQWAGRAERPGFNLPNLPLHVHERVDPAVIVRATLRNNGNGQPALFDTPGENLPLERAIQFYRHQRNWTNRFIAGDSLLVMNSLLDREHMGGRVQCVYMDPPYGIKYGSNFQPFVNQRDVKDGSDSDLTSEPEMIRAFRDTWELGVHSYLSYLRDRLLLCRKLLAETGSCFVQISDENVHLVRCVMDEIFGAENFIAMIAYKVSSGTSQKKAPRRIADYVLWFAKNKEEVKFNRLVEPNPIDTNIFRLVEDKKGGRRPMTPEEKQHPERLGLSLRPYMTQPLHSRGAGDDAPRKFDGDMWTVPVSRHWSHSPDGFARLVERGRIVREQSTIRSIRYHDDFPYEELTSNWTDTGPEGDKIYVVQTSPRPVQRCILMSTDPGDLVLDPTCGSGTIACVAEQWGRRWMTCDTSRVALTLARQRLMTATFPYYRLQDEVAGVDSGLALDTVERTTLKSIANDLPPETVTLHDRPKVDRTKVRVAGPFTMEAVPSPVTRPVRSPEELAGLAEAEAPASGEVTVGDEEARRGETHRQGMWEAEFERTGIRLKGGRRLEVENVRPYLADAPCLHSVFNTREKTPKAGFVSFGPEHAPMSRRQVDRALEEARGQKPPHALLVFAAFEFDPEASRRLDEERPAGMSVLKVKISPDIQTGDLRRSRSGDDSFWLMGSPDVELRRLGSGENKGKWVVEVRGFDYYDPVSGGLTDGGPGDIAIWMLDTDYNGRSVYPRQVFFPLSDGRRMWRRLARSLQAEVDEALMERFAGKVSLPFELTGRRVAVRIVDNRGIESLRVLRAEE